MVYVYNSSISTLFIQSEKNTLWFGGKYNKSTVKLADFSYVLDLKVTARL